MQHLVEPNIAPSLQQMTNEDTPVRLITERSQTSNDTIRELGLRPSKQKHGDSTLVRKQAESFASLKDAIPVN